VHPVRCFFFLILSGFLLATLISCFEPHEDCVTVYVKNSTSRWIEVSSPDCEPSKVSIMPGSTSGISVLLGRGVWINGYMHVFREEYEIWEIW
jgi:hypothetical protein